MTYASIIASAELNWNGDADENGTGDPNDNTANGRNGTWVGTPDYGTAPYGAGKSFVFDGASAVRYVYGSGGGNRCVSFWFKTSSSSGEQTMMSYTSSGTARMIVRILDGELKVIPQGSDSVIAGSVADNIWHHVAVVFNGTDTRFYLDDTLVYTGGSTGSYFSSTEVSIGADVSSQGPNYYTGEIYDLIVEQGGTAWTVGDVADLYAEGTTPADVTPPTLTGVVISATGDTITLTFDEAVTGSTGFTLTATSAVTMTYSSGDTTTSLVYTLSRTVGYSESLLLDYTAGNVTDIATNALATISDRLVTNQSLVGAGGSGTVLASGIKTGGQL